MDAERWRVVESLYHAALEVAAGERVALLGSAEPDVRGGVGWVIGYGSQGGGGFRARPVTEPAERAGPVFQAGEVLNSRFRIVRLIGSGGMGEVYEAADLVIGEAVALKTIRPDVAAQEVLRSRLVEEVRAAKQVVHPGICRIHD